MTEEFWSSLENRPLMKEGLRMKLYHLTGHARVLGCMKTTLFAKNVKGRYTSWMLIGMLGYVSLNLKLGLF